MQKSRIDIIGQNGNDGLAYDDIPPDKPVELSLREKAMNTLNYNGDSGIFTYKTTRGRMVEGDVAGYVDDKGYIRIGIDNKNYRAHRLAFLFIEGALRRGAARRQWP